MAALYSGVGLVGVQRRGAAHNNSIQVSGTSDGGNKAAFVLFYATISQALLCGRL